MDPAAIAAVLAPLDRELWLVTAAAGGKRGGLLATFVSTASIVPEMPRMAIGIARQHHTWELIEASDAFALHLFGEEHLDWAWRFGMRSGRDGDKLEGLRVATGTTGAPLLLDAMGWLECRVEARHDTGDRTVYLAEVVAGHTIGAAPILTAQRLFQLAPAEKLHELKAQMARDIVVDAAAIRAWRERRGMVTREVR